MPDDLRMERVADAEAPTIRVSGEIDASNSGVFFQTLTSLSNSDFELVLDLRDLTYIDSAGIRALFAISRRLTEHRQRLWLVLTPESGLRRSLAYGGLLDVVGVRDHPHEEEGERSSNSPPSHGDDHG